MAAYRLSNHLIRSRVVPRAIRAAEFAGAVMAGVILSWGLGFARESSLHDGAYWNHLAQTERLTYIEGYIDAMEASVKILKSLRIAAELLHWKGSRKILTQVNREMVISDSSANQLMHYVNELYSDPNYRDLELVEAMQLAVARSDTSTSDSLIGGAK